MPAPSSNDELLDLIRKSAVIDEKRLAGALDSLRAAGSLPNNPGELAGRLVHDGILTLFQAEQFLKGRWRGFTIGKYRVLERLGVGGMGSVYLCEHMIMRRRVAVKVLPPDKVKESSSLDRFHREARAVAAVDHPNIVRAYDVDQDDKIHFLVMEHVDGSNLQDIIKKHGPMDVTRAAHYMRQAALGLQHAHETANLVHRDIKPGNILVDRYGIVKILDMGLARFFNDDEDSITKKYDENTLGTADYLAPEQAIDSHRADIRADIYSLGGTFYYLLTGRPPFSEGSVAQKLIWHQTRQPKPIQSTRPEVPDGIIAVIDRMMTKAVADRFQTPLEVADALAPWTQTPIPPPPDAEMPTLSRAASRAGSPTSEVGMSSPRVADALSQSGPMSRKPWQVNGSPASLSDSGPVRVSVPAATTRTATPQPAPRVPPDPVTTANSAATATTVPARPAPAPVRPATPRPAPAAPVAPAPFVPAPPPVAVDPEPELLPDLEPVGDEELAVEEAPRPRRGRAAPAPVGSRLYLLGGVALLVVGIAAAVAYWALTTTPEKKPDDTKSPQAVVVHVGGDTNTTLKQALARARPGTRVVLDSDVVEQSVAVTVPGVTIESAPGRQYAIKFLAKEEPPGPPVAVDAPKLLLVQKGEVVLRNVTLDGGNRAGAMVLLFGDVHGVRIDNVEFVNPGRHGLLVVDAKGTEEAPAVLKNLRFKSSPNKQFVRFLLKKGGGSAHLRFENCIFADAGSEVTADEAGAVDAATVKLPEGTTLKVAP